MMKVDRYKCAHVSLKSFPEPQIPSFDEINDKILATIEECKENDIKCIFLEVSQNYANVLGFAVQQGFNFHHVSDDSLCLTKKLKPANIPNYATHQVGGGALVLTKDLKRVLMVQEKNGQLQNMWKPPTGKVELGEKIGEGICREIFEETNVKGEFIGIVGYRERFPWIYGLNDIYFVGVMIAESEDSQMDTEEIARIRWFELDEYTSLSNKEKIFPVYKQIINKIKQCSTIDEIRKFCLVETELDYSDFNQKGYMFLSSAIFDDKSQ